ncbi:histidine kinase [Actinomyces lilanjuaniae]|uniref:histidine kinase n=1 Tax=Actinomyces lilanjuaniae TaxID=2321394 RepID=A0ABM6Z173_9ACTO|nr:ATP-binding protein [Actinomyces lilanjuaniae]AYD88866.1 histidine kinase [Actinomyces lilanjuaniae]
MTTSPQRLVVAVVSPASLGAQAAHEVEGAVAKVADVVRLRSLGALLAQADDLGTVALIVATDEVGSLDDVAAAVERFPSLRTARLVLLTERTELSNIGRAIDEDLVHEVVAVPWTPGAIATRAAAQTRRWMRDHLPDDDRRRLLGSRSGTEHSGRSPLLETLTHSPEALTRELIRACEDVLGPRPRLRLPPGVRLTHQGQAVDSVYIVVEGAVALTRDTRVGEVILHHATTGRVIGLVSLASQGRAFVTATTTTDVDLILLSIEQLDRALAENPATEQVLAALLIGSLTKRLSRSEVLQVEKIELAAALDAEKAQAQEALEALEQARLELLAQERFATLGELAAGIAHELNNPVAALGRAAEHLRSDVAALLASHPSGELIRSVGEEARSRPAASTRQERQARRALEEVVGDRDLARRLVAAGVGDPDDARALAAAPHHLEEVEHAAAIGRNERNIELATRRIRGLVSSLHTYVRPEGEMDDDVDVREVLEDALRLTAHRLRGVEVERDYEEVPVVRGRAGELAQVWTNIVANAADALATTSQDDGRVVLRVRAEQAEDTELFHTRDRQDTGGAQPPGGAEEGTGARGGAGPGGGAGPVGVRVEVEDNGPGISPEVLPRIFEPRFTTKHGQVRFGLGLGMGLARSVVDAHEGAISVESRPGRTVVTVRLPRDPALVNEPRRPGDGKTADGKEDP